jgi:hypothetical protein
MVGHGFARWVVVAVALSALLAACGSSCGPGRTCIGKAGISLALPDGWGGRSTDGKAERLLVAARGDDQQIVVSDGAAVLKAGSPTTLDAVDKAVLAMFDDLNSNPGFSRVTERLSDRVVLPIGPAVRLRATWTTSFFFTYGYSTSMYWFFVDGKLILLEYDQGWGEGTPRVPGPVEPPDLRSVLDSLRLLGSGTPLATASPSA